MPIDEDDFDTTLKFTIDMSREDRGIIYRKIDNRHQHDCPQAIPLDRYRLCVRTTYVFTVVLKSIEVLDTPSPTTFNAIRSLYTHNWEQSSEDTDGEYVIVVNGRDMAYDSSLECHVINMTYRTKDGRS